MDENSPVVKMFVLVHKVTGWIPQVASNIFSQR